jgi:hypothetical protein
MSVLDIAIFFYTYSKGYTMNKSLMKRKHMEESNILLQKRSTEKVDTQKNKEAAALIKLKKTNLSDKLINQIRKSL